MVNEELRRLAHRLGISMISDTTIFDKIEAAETPEELYAVMDEAGLAAKMTDDGIDFGKYVPGYVKKRQAKEKKRREKDQKEYEAMEGAGEPFTPPISTEDVAGL